MEQILKQLNIDCKCHDTLMDGYKYPNGIACWNTPTPAWNSMDWKAPCIGGNKKENFTESTISTARIVIFLLIIALIVWFVYKHRKQTYETI